MLCRIENSICKYNIDYQLVPPAEHRVHASERAIHTFKNHLIATFCTVDSQFPMSKWDRLIPHAVITLNQLRSSHLHPSLSAYASLFGNYDYNGMPLAPPGTREVAHSAADTRASFAPHGRVGWYIGPSPKHYCCHRIYFPDTMMECDVLKVDFFPEKTPFPAVSLTDCLMQTAQDLLHLLKHPTTKQSSLLSFGSPIHNAFTEVAIILNRACLPPSSNKKHHVTPLRVPFETLPGVTHPQQFIPQLPRVNTHWHPVHHFYIPQQSHMLNSALHDPKIAGKIFNPFTGHLET